MKNKCLRISSRIVCIRKRTCNQIRKNLVFRRGFFIQADGRRLGMSSRAPRVYVFAARRMASRRSRVWIAYRRGAIQHFVLMTYKGCALDFFIISCTSHTKTDACKCRRLFLCDQKSKILMRQRTVVDRDKVEDERQEADGPEEDRMHERDRAKRVDRYSKKA